MLHVVLFCFWRGEQTRIISVPIQIKIETVLSWREQRNENIENINRNNDGQNSIFQPSSDFDIRLV